MACARHSSISGTRIASLGSYLPEKILRLMIDTWLMP